MLSSSLFNNAVPKFTNGNYANNPVDPSYIEEPSMEDYNRGVEPLDTLPAQWWNWLCKQFTSRFNKLNTYVKNLFDEITQLLSLLNVTPDGTESVITTGQLKNFFKELYPSYVSDKLELGTTYVPQTTQVNGHALSSDISVTKSDVGLGNVVNTGDSATPVSGGTTKFTTGGAYTELAKKSNLTVVAPAFSSSTSYAVGDYVTYNGLLYRCTVAHSAGAWNSYHFSQKTVDSELTDIKANQVTGVKGSAESSYRKGDVNITKENIGLDNVDNVSFRQTAFAGLFVEDDTRSLSVSTYTFSPTPPVGSSTLSEGSVVRVFFRYTLRGSVPLRPKFNYCGCNGYIKVNTMMGSETTYSTDTVCSVLTTSTYGGYSADYPYLVWQGGTILELMWTGIEWMVIGNPVIIKGWLGTRNYRVYADKYAELWGNNYNSSVSEQYISFNVNFPFHLRYKDNWAVSVSPYSWYNESTLSSIRLAAIGVARISDTNFKFQIGYPTTENTHRGICYKATGYLEPYIS